MKRRLLDIVITTALIIGVIGALDAIPFNTGVLDPLEQAFSDFELTDLVFSRLSDDRKVRVDTNMVLVNIGDASAIDRDSLVNTFRRIGAAKPACVGIDILFDPADTLRTTALDAAIATIPNVVVACRIVESGGSTRIMDAVPNTADGGRDRGHVDLTDEGRGYKTIRSYAPFRTAGTDTVPALAVRMAQIVDAQAVLDMQLVGSEEEEIAYQRQRTWYAIEAAQLADSTVAAAILPGRIVLVGYLGSQIGDTITLEDRFFTPVNERYAGKSVPDMYGLEIHANILSSILHRDRIDHVPTGIVWFATLLLIMINVWVFAAIQDRLGLFYDLICKTTQIAEAVLLLMLAVTIFDNHRAVLDITTAVVGVILASDMYSVYLSVAESVREAVHRLRKRGSA